MTNELRRLLAGAAFFILSRRIPAISAGCEVGARSSIGGRMAVRDMEPKPHLKDGQQFGRYEVVRFLAQGGMSEVYVAVLKQPGFERRVVVKLMRPHLARITEFRKRFSIEANILASKLDDQEGVVRVTDVGAVEIVYEGSRLHVPYLVQDYLKGEDLDAWIAKGLTWSDRREIAIATCEALVAIHAADVIHRDLKPSNIFILGGVARRVRVLDFGIAKSLVPAAGAEEATALGQSIGTPTYMSPEQRLDSSSVERSSDIYSFGCVLFAMICGFSPKDARNTRCTRNPRDLVTSTPHELDRLIASMLEHSPANRPATMSDVLQRLTTLRWPTDGVMRPDDRPLAWIIATIISGIAVVGVGVGLLLQYKSCSSSSQPMIDGREIVHDVGAPDEVPPVDAPVEVIDAAVSLNDFVDIKPGSGSPIQATWVRGRVALPGLKSPTAAYAIQAHEVTWREWKQFARASELPQPRSDTDDMPVRGVSYELAEAFCKALPDPARLPTQAEWQWVATLRDERAYPWGEEPPDPHRMVFLGSALLPLEAAQTTQDILTLPEGTKIYDLMGNVEEWTSSKISQGHDEGEYRVTRGFSLGDVTDQDERTARLKLGARGVSRLCASGKCPVPGVAAKNIGFRCVRAKESEHSETATGTTKPHDNKADTTSKPRQRPRTDPNGPPREPLGYLQVFSKPEAEILVDRHDTGFKTPIAGHMLPLAPGMHKITFVIGDDHFTYPVLIKAGTTDTMSKDLQ